MRLAIVYDCLYPWTVGGAERWLRLLADDLSSDCDVTYVTRRQWAVGEQPPDLPGVRVVQVAPGGDLYTTAGRRRIGPPLRFGLGVLGHFVRHRRDYDVVHCVSFPFFSLLAVRAGLAGRPGVRVVVEWLEYWSSAYWREYLGSAGGAVGRAVQRLCLVLTPSAVVFSQLNEGRLRSAGHGGPLEVLPGLWDGEARPPEPATKPPRAVYVGRHIPEKRATVVPGAVALARRRLPELRATVLGDGPQRERVRARVAALGLEEVVDVPGFVDDARLERELRGAACLIAPSLREGHGMAVVEAAAMGVPVVVCRHPDNAAVELVEDGVNGFIAADASEAGVAEAVVRAVEAGEELRSRTADWFERNRGRLSAAASISRLRELYAG